MQKIPGTNSQKQRKMAEEKWVMIQKQLFAMAKAKLKAHEALVDEVGEALGIGQDSAYRRLRCEKPLSIDELARLAQRFRFSLDELFGTTSQTVSFHYKNLETADDFLAHLRNLEVQLKALAATPNTRLYYGAADVPLFLHFLKPEHAGFKLFYWQQAVMQLPELKDLPFSPDLVDAEVLEVAMACGSHYQQIAGIEIWTEESVITTLRQIKYYHDAGLFAQPGMAKLITEQYLELMKMVRTWAERGYKSDENPQNSFQLFESDISIGNNCVLTEMENKKVAYLRHQTFNSMLTANDTFCNETELFLKGLMRRANMISGFAEKQRLSFFNRIQEPINQLMQVLG